MTASTTASLSAADGTQLLLRRWRAAGEAWADVLLVHGIAEHSGRYEHVGQWLADAGIEVTGFDLRGFGGSDGRRAFVERWTDYHDDLRAVLASVRHQAAGRPVAIYGHSMGGLIALGYAVADPPRPEPDALVLSAPALDATIPVWKRAIARILGAVAPAAALKNDFDGELLSRDPEVGRAYLADPANYHRTTVRLGAEGLAEQRRVKAGLGRLTIPTLVYHGEDDRLVPTASSEALAALPTVARRTYPRLRHESHNEPEGAEVVADVVAWLRSVLQSGHN
jgi:alpha-beta hydrolase superfamily lysophospholipase